ncbi:hypothetical protein KSF_085560 [Reticulibacter mediterranei]|uniref:Uncharacterized protein n=1 Tax=Reticulibacter mediterranei TaxID=2778369 RepID=A0A8J3IQR6_9CHLR|nr:hypothetical protein [Reticulibacter mediterranei]GHO98508.1 hypothetical protein KSF_085560 [Reticulibacter mediterranei]
MKKTCVSLLFLVRLVWILAACQTPLASNPAPDGYMRVSDDGVRYMTWTVNDDKTISVTWSFLVPINGKLTPFTGTLTGHQDGEKITVTTDPLGKKITSNGTIKDGVMVLNAVDPKTGAINKVTYTGVTTEEFNQALIEFKKKYPPAQQG